MVAVFRRSSCLLLVQLALALQAQAANGPAGIHLNASSFYATLHAPMEGRWFVLFFSPQCGHCSAMMPAWAELESRLAEGSAKPRHKLAVVDATAEKLLADRLDVNGYPTLMVVANGTIYEYEGGRLTQEMLDFIQSDDIKAAARDTRRLPRAPSHWDPLLRVPGAVDEIGRFALHSSPIAAALLAIMLCALGASFAMLSRSTDAQFITVECPPNVKPGQEFTVEFYGGT